MRKATLVKIDKNGTKYYEDYTCDHCGGAGGADAWTYTGYTCWKCGGTGRMSTPQKWKEYTPEYQAILDARRAKKHEKELAELRANAPAVNAKFFKGEGCDEQGRTWVVLGDTYPIREELKSLGCKFNYTFGWHADHDIEGYQTLVLDLKDFYDVDEYGIYSRGNFDKISDYIDKANRPESEEVSSSEYVGQVGDKIEIKVELINIVSYKTYIYGREIWNDLYLFRDEQGNEYKWNTQSICELSKGDVASIKATIKEHSEYKGTKQTVLTRVKVIEKEVA